MLVYFSSHVSCYFRRSGVDQISGGSIPNPGFILSPVKLFKGKDLKATQKGVEHIVCVCVYMYCEYVYAWAHLCVHVYVHVLVCTRVHMCACMHCVYV